MPALLDMDLPVIPSLPIIGGGVTLHSNRDVNSIIDNKNVGYVSSGSAAILLALQLHGVNKGDQVLIPAYHCPTMVEPVITLGATPVFYAITETIDVDLASIAEKISHQVKAILVPHFFGRRQNIVELKEYCNLPKSIAVIEDCAHTFFVSEHDAEMQSDYLIGSLTKFFPVYDGGVLISKLDHVQSLQALTFVQELKALYNLLHIAAQYGRLKLIAWAFYIVSYLRREGNNQEDASVESKQNDDLYEEEKVVVCSASKVCRYIVNNSDFEEIVKKRRQNYRYIIEELKGEPSLDLSLNAAENDFMPYMVIARLKNPEKNHPALIGNRLPIWRWEHIYSSDCKISKLYSKAIIQIPCHQQLNQEDLVALVRGIRESLSED